MPHPEAHSTPGARYLTAISTVVEYLRLSVVPLRLHIDYMPQVIAIAHRPTGPVVLGALILIAAVLLAWYTRRGAPPVAFAIVLFAIAIAPVAYVVFPSGIIVAERTLYLPSIAVAIIAGWAWDHRPVGRLALAAPVLAACAIIALGVRTWTRTPVWRDNKSAIMASLHDEPESYVAHERAADVFERSGDTLAAIREYAIARTLYPGDPYLYQAAAAILVTRGDSGVMAAEQVLDSAAADRARSVCRHDAARMGAVCGPGFPRDHCARATRLLAPTRLDRCDHGAHTGGAAAR